MKPARTKTVHVLYKFVDGAHFFVSNDRDTVGLCIADKNLETAFNAVAPALKKLFKENHGQDANFVPSTKYLEFKKRISRSWPNFDNDKYCASQVSPAGGVQWNLAA